MTDFTRLEQLDDLGEHIAREQDALLAKHNVQAEVRTRVAELDIAALRQASKANATRHAGLVWAGGGVALAAAALALISVRGLGLDLGDKPEPQALSVQLVEQHQNLEVGQYVQAPQSKDVGLRFSDGSHIEVAERSRARLMGLRSNGADVSLESGLMHVQVQHRTETSWHISAGPFGVHVIGTRFDVQWKPEDDSFELTLHEGKVELSGCAFNEAYRVHAGKTVRASCKNENYVVTAAGEAMPAAGSGSVESFDSAAPQQQQETAVEAKPETTPAAQPTTRQDKPAAPKPDYRALARSGRYNQALRAAKAAGFEEECAHSNVRDLSLLAYAARYAQDTESEALAWRLLRERFRGTKDAAIAAFALGRIEFDNHGAYAKAAEWFRTYLREQPQGDLTREALGRLLEATQHLGDRASARELAARYLREYPDGPYAGLAARLRDDADAR